MVGTRVYLGGLSTQVRERDIDDFLKDYNGIGEISIKNGFAFVEFDDDREADDAIIEMNGKRLLGGRVTVEKAKGTPRAGGGGRGYGRGGGGGYGGGRGYGGGGGRYSGFGYGRRNGGGGGGNRYGGGRNNNYGGNNSRFGAPSRTKYRVSVSNLSSSVSWQDLKDYMRQAGEVTFADAHKLRKNEGIVDFVSYSDMKNAISKLDGSELRGRRIELREENRDGGESSYRRGGSRSRSRSYSRSRSRSASRSRSRSRSRTPQRSASPYGGRRSRSRSFEDEGNAGYRSRSRSPYSRNGNGYAEGDE